MNYEIKNDVMPSTRVEKKKKSISEPIKNTLDMLEVGNCFYIEYTPKNRNLLSSIITTYSARTGKLFKTRKIAKDQQMLI